MKKEAYFKLMGLQKKGGNVAGPFLGGMSGMVAADWLAHVIHNNPGFFTRAIYDIPGAYLGILAGNKLQNKLQDTNRGALWDDKDSTFWDNVYNKALQTKHKKELAKADVGVDANKINPAGEIQPQGTQEMI